MSEEMYRPSKIPISEFIKFRDYSIVPVDGFEGLNITRPPNMVYKKRVGEDPNSVRVLIRTLFNSVTRDNIQVSQERLRSIIREKAVSPEVIDDIASEILESFLISSVNIDNYMQVLNAADRMCVELKPRRLGADGKPECSKTVGFIFLQKCRLKILKFTRNDFVRKLGELDQDDPDSLDYYGRERDKIVNLILTICAIYSQRKTRTLRLTADHIYPVINIIMNAYLEIVKIMKNLGDPSEPDPTDETGEKSMCSDEEEYEMQSRMGLLYLEQLFTFMDRCAREFIEDDSKVRDPSGNMVPNPLVQIVHKWRYEIVPNIQERYLSSRCESIDYGKM